jgi:hypothetical protein
MDNEINSTLVTGLESLTTNEVPKTLTLQLNPFSDGLKSKINKSLESGKSQQFWNLATSLRDQWEDCRKKAADFRTSRDLLAQTLCEIRTLLAPEGLFANLLDEAGVKRRTAYDMIADHTRVRDLPEVVRKEAARQHVDLTANRLASKIASMGERLRAARTREDAAPLISELKAQKRKSPIQEALLPSIRDGRRTTIIAQARAFLEPVSSDPIALRSQVQALLDEIVSAFGLTVTVSEGTEGKETA